MISQRPKIFSSKSFCADQKRLKLSRREILDIGHALRDNPKLGKVLDGTNSMFRVARFKRTSGEPLYYYYLWSQEFGEIQCCAISTENVNNLPPDDRIKAIGQIVGVVTRACFEGLIGG